MWFSLTNCCYCISLEVGAQIISILSLIVALAETAYCVWSAAMMPLTQIKMITVFIVVAVMALFEAFCACLLIRGVFSKKANSTIPWLVLSWVKSFACLAVASFGIAVLVLKSDNPQSPETPALIPGEESTVTPINVTESVVTGAPTDVPGVDKTVTFIVIVVVCILQAFLLMYFACVVNSRRKQIRDDDYSHYAPVRSDSIRNVYVPITKQIPPRPYYESTS